MMGRVNQPDLPNRTILLTPKLVVRESSGINPSPTDPIALPNT